LKGFSFAHIKAFNVKYLLFEWYVRSPLEEMIFSVTLIIPLRGALRHAELPWLVFDMIQTSIKRPADQLK